MEYGIRRSISPLYLQQWKDHIKKNGYILCPVIGCGIMFHRVCDIEQHYVSCTGKADSVTVMCSQCYALLPSSDQIQLHNSVLHAADNDLPRKNDKKKVLSTVGDNDRESDITELHGDDISVIVTSQHSLLTDSESRNDEACVIRPSSTSELEMSSLHKKRLYPSRPHSELQRPFTGSLECKTKNMYRQGKSVSSSGIFFKPISSYAEEYVKHGESQQSRSISASMSDPLFIDDILPQSNKIGSTQISSVERDIQRGPSTLKNSLIFKNKAKPKFCNVLDHYQVDQGGCEKNVSYIRKDDSGRHIYLIDTTNALASGNSVAFRTRGGLTPSSNEDSNRKLAARRLIEVSLPRYISKNYDTKDIYCSNKDTVMVGASCRSGYESDESDKEEVTVSSSKRFRHSHFGHEPEEEFCHIPSDSDVMEEENCFQADDYVTQPSTSYVPVIDSVRKYSHSTHIKPNHSRIDTSPDPETVYMKRYELAEKEEELKRAEEAIKLQEEAAQEKIWQALQEQQVALLERERNLKQREYLAQKKLEEAARLIAESKRLGNSKRFAETGPRFVPIRPRPPPQDPGKLNMPSSSLPTASKPNIQCDLVSHTAISTSDMLVQPGLIFSSDKIEVAAQPKLRNDNCETVNQTSVNSQVKILRGRKPKQIVYPYELEEVLPTIEPSKILRTYSRTSKKHVEVRKILNTVPDKSLVKLTHFDETKTTVLMSAEESEQAVKNNKDTVTITQLPRLNESAVLSCPSANLNSVDIDIPTTTESSSLSIEDLQQKCPSRVERESDSPHSSFSDFSASLVEKVEKLTGKSCTYRVVDKPFLNRELQLETGDRAGSVRVTMNYDGYAKGLRNIASPMRTDSKCVLNVTHNVKQHSKQKLSMVTLEGVSLMGNNDQSINDSSNYEKDSKPIVCQIVGNKSAGAIGSNAAIVSGYSEATSKSVLVSKDINKYHTIKKELNADQRHNTEDDSLTLICPRLHNLKQEYPDVDCNFQKPNKIVDADQSTMPSPRISSERHITNDNIRSENNEQDIPQNIIKQECLKLIPESKTSAVSCRTEDHVMKRPSMKCVYTEALSNSTKSTDSDEYLSLHADSPIPLSNILETVNKQVDSGTADCSEVRHAVGGGISSHAISVKREPSIDKVLKICVPDSSCSKLKEDLSVLNKSADSMPSTVASNFSSLCRTNIPEVGEGGPQHVLYEKCTDNRETVISVPSSANSTQLPVVGTVTPAVIEMQNSLPNPPLLQVMSDGQCIYQYIYNDANGQALYITPAVMSGPSLSMQPYLIYNAHSAVPPVISEEPKAILPVDLKVTAEIQTAGRDNVVENVSTNMTSVEEPIVELFPVDSDDESVGIIVPDSQSNNSCCSPELEMDCNNTVVMDITDKSSATVEVVEDMNKKTYPLDNSCHSHSLENSCHSTSSNDNTVINEMQSTFSDRHVSDTVSAVAADDLSGNRCQLSQECGNAGNVDNEDALHSGHFVDVNSEEHSHSLQDNLATNECKSQGGRMLKLKDWWPGIVRNNEEEEPEEIADTGTSSQNYSGSDITEIQNESGIAQVYFSERKIKQECSTRIIDAEPNDSIASSVVTIPLQPEEISRPEVLVKPMINDDFLIDDNMELTCGKCDETLSSQSKFNHHVYMVHNGLARLKGESQDFLLSEARKLVSAAYRELKPYYTSNNLPHVMTCEGCEKPFKSLLGFKYHIENVCLVDGTKTDCILRGNRAFVNEKFGDLCREKSLNTSRSKHKRAVANHCAEGIEEHMVELSINDNDEDSVEIGDASVSKLFTSRRVVLSDLDMNALLQVFEEKLKDSNIAKCVNDGCELQFADSKKLKFHLKACLKAPMQYFCSLCRFASNSSSEITSHISSCHSNCISETENDSDYDFDRIRCDNLNRSMRRYTTNSLIFGPAFSMTKEFRSENYLEHLLPEFVSLKSHWQEMLCEDYKQYLPVVSTSPKFKILSSNPPGKCSRSWVEMERFSGISLESSKIIFTGGPVQNAAWCHLPDHVTSHRQFLALSCEGNPDRVYPINQSVKHTGIIQIWCCSLDDDSAPFVAFSIAHDFGISWSLEWCPSGIFEDINCLLPTNCYRRLGLLGSSFSDGSIRIFVIPDPEQLEDRAKVYMKPPDISLLPFSFDSMNVQCTNLSWCPSIGHSLIAGSFSNGIVCIWNIAVQSDILRSCDNDGNIILYPVTSIKAHQGVCLTVSFCPTTGGQHIVTGGSDRIIKFWDLTQPELPLTIIRKGIITDTIWLPHWAGAFIANDDVFSLEKTYTSFRENGFYGSTYRNSLVSNASVKNIAASDWFNAIAQVDEAGEVVISFQHSLVCDTVSEKKCKKRISVFCVRLQNIKTGKVLSLKDEYSSSSNKGGDAAADEDNCGATPATPKSFVDNELKPDKFSDYPLSYESAAREFGVIFCDEFDVPPTAEIVESKQYSYLMEPGPLTVYPLMGSSCVSWNNNVGSNSWIFIGMKSGFGRLIRLTFLETK